MDALDGRELLSGTMKHFVCENDHVMGVMVRERVALQAGRVRVRYMTTRLLIFRNAVDLTAEVPAQIDVAGSLDGKILSMRYRCSVCGKSREWHPEPGVVELLAETYHAE